MRLLTAFVRRHRWWLIPELLAIAVVAAGLVYLRSNGLNQQLAERAQLTLEQLAPAELELIDIHGHENGHSGKVICTAETFGMEPASAERLEEVRVIYARYLCALVQKGTPWDYATRSSGPAVITLAEPPSVQIALSGTGYPERVRAIIPDRLQRQAFAGFSDHARPNTLLSRYNAEAR